MDTRQYMIVDLERRGDREMFITERVASIDEKSNGLWAVRFQTSSRIYNFTPYRLLCLKHPERIDTTERGLYVKNRHINHIAELLRFADRFHTFYRVFYANGQYEDIDGHDVYLTRTRIDQHGGSIWEYLRKLADETGLTAEGGANLLSAQYNLVDLQRDNVPLAQYLGSHAKLHTYNSPQLVLYPFGCNASQKTAVEAALTHQVSIIQGPPGTGKTQTILNIMANLLMEGQTMLVVSNNNSAIENVAEKLEAEGIGFIAAKLGSVQNKEAFTANQPNVPDMGDWVVTEPAAIGRTAARALHIVSQGFEGQTRQATLRAEYDALLKEAKYNELSEQGTTAEKWLYAQKSARIIELLTHYRRTVEKGRRPSLLFRLRWSCKWGLKMLAFLKGKPSKVISCLEEAYYRSRKLEIEEELARIASTLHTLNLKQGVKDLRSSSLQLLKNKIAKRYATRKRRKFAINDIKPQTSDFLKEYPVVLSTTYSAKSCISKDMVFDYVIMDEASQVDIKTGALALSCAMNAVIVGDDKQLPNVVSREESLALNAIQRACKIDDRYNAVTHSFLQSCVEVFDGAPTTLLREHYRCHPKIIEFCNRHFYHGELVAMTQDNGETNVLRVIRTTKGNHARGHFNQREIDVIVQEVLPQEKTLEGTGVITPYRQQAEEINKALGQDMASTVHKYQGRECDTIVMSTVDNAPTAFSDDPNLLNVAISRAKKHLYIVTNGNEMPQDTNLAQLIGYIQYNNFEVRESKIHSVFDLLYKQYTAERLAYESTHPAVSEHLSENLIYHTLTQAIAELGMANTGVLCHYPLSRLIADRDLLDEQEKAFADSPSSHVDFLIYNSLTKRPLRTIEVDGWHFHRKNEVQLSRDAIKDRLLAKCGLRPYRIATTDTVTVVMMKDSVLRPIQLNSGYGSQIRPDLSGLTPHRS